jgi:hypothetical protein
MGETCCETYCHVVRFARDDVSLAYDAVAESDSDYLTALDFHRSCPLWLVVVAYDLIISLKHKHVKHIWHEFYELVDIDGAATATKKTCLSEDILFRQALAFCF